MSQENLNQTNKQLFVGTDTSKIFLGENTTMKNALVNNSDYDPISLPAGTVMGRVTDTDVLAPCISTNSDGSEQPIGVLMQDLDIDDGDTVQACVCDGGRVAAEKISFFHPTDSLNSQVDGTRMKDLLARNTTIKLVYSNEHTKYDNH